jgi:hypothetical protein
MAKKKCTKEKEDCGNYEANRKIVWGEEKEHILHF